MMRTASVVLASLSVAGCSEAPLARPAVDLAPFEALGADAFPGAAKVLAGFAPADDDPAIRVGDAALLGIELRRDGEITRQLLLLEVAALPLVAAGENGARVRVEESVDTKLTLDVPPAGPRVERRTSRFHPVDVRLTRHDARGMSSTESTARLHEEPLATGWWPATTMESPDAWHFVLALSLSLQELATQDAVLQDLLFLVVDRPSAWSIVTHLGVKVVMHWNLTIGAAPRRVEAMEFSTEVRNAPVELRVNGDTASWVDMFVVKPNGATMVCGGLVGAIARHPTDPGRIAVVRLLATRRGARP